MNTQSSLTEKLTKISSEFDKPRAKVLIDVLSFMTPTLWLVTVQPSSSPTTSHILDVMCSFCKFLRDKKNTQSIVNNKTTLKHSHLIMELNPGPLALATSALATELRQPMSSKNFIFYLNTVE